ncbi:MAG TPA: HipA domain-containing protein [Longimicrobium sp.]|nr:HipA domain-containing protein [Longimicrobium sp.]
MPHYDVLLHDVLAGQIAHDPPQDRSSFRFLEDYRRLPRRPVLGQHFEDDLGKAYSGKRGALPPWFANLVPEGALRDLLRRSLGLETDADLPILAAVGRDLPGAVEVLPAAIDAGLFANGSIQEGEGDARDYAETPVQTELALRFSLPGVQMKFSVLREQEKITLPVHGQLGDWIVKLDSRRFPGLVENEFATMEWARAAGLQVPECQIASLEILPPALRSYAPDGTNVFLIRRYDRDGKRRIHQEDFAQLVNLPPALKYEQVTYEGCAKLVQQIVGPAGYRELVRRLAFMVASGNMDAHLKNWSLLYPDDISAVLSPLYDQVATIAWPDETTRELALKFAGTKDPFRVDIAAFARLAEKSGGDVKETIRIVQETIERTAAAWSTSVASEAMPREHAERLREYWSRASLVKDHLTPGMFAA